MAHTLRVPTSLESLTLVPTASYEADGSDGLWAQALQKALDDLPAKESRWLSDERNRAPFTSTQITEAVRPFQEKYSNRPVQRFIAKIDPILSHVRSFAGILGVFANANPVGAGITWRCIYLVLVVAGKTQESLEKILDILSELSPQLTLFSRWHRLFPQKSFVEVGDAIKDTYYAIIGFCVTAIRYLRRKPFSKPFSDGM
ncbi:MAG: hypothetical protein Q9173_002455 [Seirophora scorigena]